MITAISTRMTPGMIDRRPPAPRSGSCTAGLVQGIVLVTFPAASTIFTDPDEYDLSSTAYGTLFIPQVITAIAGALLGAGLARRFGAKRVYLAGLAFSLAAMALLVTTTLLTEDSSSAYALLLVATACLGAGFGLAVPLLNTFTAAFHPAAVDRSVLVLNALLGLGTALAPVFVAIFVGLGFWWGLPVLSAVMLVGLLVASAGLPLHAGGPAPAREARSWAAIPARFWIFAAFAVLYGLCETMNGNWSQLDMTTSDATAGWVIASYQLGYRIAAFGAGPLHDAGVSLPAIFAASAVAALVMAALSFVIARPTHRIPALHPRPV